MIQNLEGENIGEMAHCNNWQIIFWRMPKPSRKSKVFKKNEVSASNKNSLNKMFHRDFTA